MGRSDCRPATSGCFSEKEDGAILEVWQRRYNTKLVGAYRSTTTRSNVSIHVC